MWFSFCYYQKQIFSILEEAIVLWSYYFRFMIEVLAWLLIEDDIVECWYRTWSLDADALARCRCDLNMCVCSLHYRWSGGFHGCDNWKCVWSLEIISTNGDDKMPTWLLGFIINGVPSALLEIPCTKRKCSQIYFIGFKCVFFFLSKVKIFIL